MKRFLKRVWLGLRLLLLLLMIALVFDRETEGASGISGRVLASTRGYTFNYVEWELEALLSKAQQELFGFHPYIAEAERNQLVLDYMSQQNRVWQLEGQIAAQNNPDTLSALNDEHHTAQQKLLERQALVEHIIEGQVSAVLQDEELAWLGQIVPPVTMRFLSAPDVLVVSPRHEIRQYMTVTLIPQDLPHRAELEARIAAAVPEMSVWITPVGGVGLWPSMVMATDRAVVAFEITAHEWTHHYLFFYPLGLEYLSHPDTRIINETTATLVGDEIGNKVIERFYAAELAAGQVYLQATPDYRLLLAALNGASQNTFQNERPSPFEANEVVQRNTNRALADYLVSLGRVEAAQLVLNRKAAHNTLLGYTPPTDPTTSRMDTDQNGWIHHTRVSVDYLLKLGNIEAAELVMDNGEQHTGLRVLNQAWFAFNAGYQSNPVVEQRADGSMQLVTRGGGGDPIGAAIYEIRARSANLKAFLAIMRGITTREALLTALEQLRAEQESQP